MVDGSMVMFGDSDVGSVGKGSFLMVVFRDADIW